MDGGDVHLASTWAQPFECKAIKRSLSKPLLGLLPRKRLSRLKGESGPACG
jgi:hypothetical protein